MSSIHWNQKKIFSILNIFEEGFIESLKFSKEDLNFGLECAFLADIIDKNFTKFYGVFKNCSDIYFKPWDDDSNTIECLSEIVALKLFLLNAEIADESYIKLYCNCGRSHSGGNLYVKADDLIIYNQEFEEISLDFLNEIAVKYWYDITAIEN